jgi:5-(aminomethyl)-3-furanmethanol phosphate kinase
MTLKQNPAISQTPIVVKLGGSLIARVPDLIPVLSSSKRPLFIVPGGGVFADTVRNASVDDTSAHWMAIAAMDQYGWFIGSHGLKVTSMLRKPEQSVVFLPYCSLMRCDPLPHSWSVTSDSIAAWIADTLSLDLLLLKSVDGILDAGILQEEVGTPCETDIVDPFLIPFVLKKKIRTTIINGTRIEYVEKYLRQEVVPGTRIGTTF